MATPIEGGRAREAGCEGGGGLGEAAVGAQRDWRLRRTAGSSGMYVAAGLWIHDRYEPNQLSEGVCQSDEVAAAGRGLRPISDRSGGRQVAGRPAAQASRPAPCAPQRGPHADVSFKGFTLSSASCYSAISCQVGPDHDLTFPARDSSCAAGRTVALIGAVG